MGTTSGYGHVRTERRSGVGAHARCPRELGSFNQQGCMSGVGSHTLVCGVYTYELMQPWWLMARETACSFTGGFKRRVTLMCPLRVT